MADFRTELKAALKDPEVRKLLVSALFRTDDVVDSPEGEGSVNPHWWAQSYLREQYLLSVKTDDEVKAIKAKVDSLSAGGVDLDVLAVKVADEIYKRMSS